MVYQILKHAHSGLRWVVLLLLIISVISTFLLLLSRGKYSKVTKILAISTLSFSHIQLLVGLVLYFISDKVVFSVQSFSTHLTRFYLIEHSLLMIIALILITIGYSRHKKAKNDQAKLAQLFIFYTLGLILIIIAIPWPWKNLAGGWY